MKNSVTNWFSLLNDDRTMTNGHLGFLTMCVRV